LLEPFLPSASKRIQAQFSADQIKKDAPLFLRL